MASYGRSVRQGLPRVRGGEPWPPAGEVPEGVAALVAEAAAPAAAAVAAPAAAPVAEPAAAAAGAPASEPQATPAPAAAAPAASVAAPTPAAAAPAASVAVRRGLPRVAGGEPWPPAGAAPAPSAAAPSASVAAPVAGSPAAASEPVSAPHAAPVAATATLVVTASETPLRRGLPRTIGGEAWPPAGFAPSVSLAAAPEAAPVAETAAEAQLAAQSAAPAQGAAPAASAAIAPAAPARLSIIDGRTPIDTPLAGPRTVTPGVYAFTRRPEVEPQRIGPFTRTQWFGSAVVGGVVLLLLAAMAVFGVRWLLSTAFGQDFLASYPGEYHLPETAPVGLPAWIGWQHFFNVFLMVLIIRSGLQVRNQKKAPAFWSPKNNPKRKISINLWFHQALDVLWLSNGVIFIVLLFVTGQWMRIVPTSWEVFPNALSAILQYISLDWPTENGWVNYNSIQQIAYFTTVFIAAPLAAITGIRMSGFWPKDAPKLNKAYPVEWARAVHFPTMLYFVLFIFVHVVLVFATGALRNLNHMYASQGSVDPTAYADNWAGAIIFGVSLLAIIGAWVAARPLLIAPIAKLFGTVAAR